MAERKALSRSKERYYKKLLVGLSRVLRAAAVRVVYLHHNNSFTSKSYVFMPCLLSEQILLLKLWNMGKDLEEINLIAITSYSKQKRQVTDL
jgi:hypothetical protein